MIKGLKCPAKTCINWRTSGDNWGYCMLDEVKMGILNVINIGLAVVCMDKKEMRGG